MKPALVPLNRTTVAPVKFVPLIDTLLVAGQKLEQEAVDIAAVLSVLSSELTEVG